MATIRHKRIQLLQSFTPRLIDPNDNPLTLSPTSATININENAQAELVAQNTITLEAFCTRSGTVINWSTTQGTLSSTTGSQVTLTYSAVPVTDMSSITVTATTAAADKYQPTTLTKTAIITKVAPAQTSVELTLYQRSAQAPVTLPSAATYNTNTKSIAGTLNGWQASIPAGTDSVYIIKATVSFYKASTNYARPVTGWQSIAKLAENGISGDSVDIIYQRALSIPSTPTSSVVVPQGWYSDVSAVPSTPIGGSIWASTGTKLGGGTTYTWGLPVVITGSNIVELTIFIRAGGLPSTPSGGTYNFSTKQVVAPGQWSAAFPTGTDPVYTSRITASSGDATATVTLGTWQPPVLTVQNGTNGSNATVTLATMVSAIDAVNGDYIKLNDQSTAYVTGNNSGTGVYIGAGGIYGKNGSTSTFAFNAATGQAAFQGDIDTLGKGKFAGITTAGSSATIPVSLYGLANTQTDVGVFGLIGRTSSDIIYSGVQGRVADPSTLGSCTYNNVAGVAGINYQNQLYSYAGYFDASNAGGYALFAQRGLINLQAGVHQLNMGSYQSNSTIDIPSFATSSTVSVFKGLSGTSNCLELQGVYPTLKFNRTGIGTQPWVFRHDASNFVLNFGSNTNDFVFNSAGNFEARGNVTAYSDKIIKTHIRPISQAASKLKQINGYQYKNLLANKHDCGIIAQEIEKILPELVQVSQTEYEGSKVKTVNYNGVVALLVAANRELIARIEALEAKLK